MQQVKIFKSIESELWSMENEINTWIKESGAKVISVTGNIAPQSGGASAMGGTFSASDVLVIVTYEK
ncbi:MAG: hypothetical protein J5I93_10975 [Pirellulaceae bacterium]|nr:hypothetical protein [Pirellulaceae bacterium]